MARRSHQALSAVAAGACLALCACGSGSSPAAAGSPSVTASDQPESAVMTGHFCNDASSFMRHIPAAPKSKHLTAAQARANLRKVLHATVAGFTALDKESPARLHKPLRAIVAVYKSDEKKLRTARTISQMSHAMVKGEAAADPDFQKVLKYVSANCK
jgi:hypothetical protein